MISTSLTTGQNVSLSTVSGNDRVVIRHGRQMAWQLWKHLLVSVKQTDEFWLWPALQLTTWSSLHQLTGLTVLCSQQQDQTKGEVTRKYRFWRTYSSLRPTFPLSCQRTWESLISEKAAGLFQDSRWCVLQILCTLPANFSVTGCAVSRIAVHTSSGQCERYCQEVCRLWNMPALLANTGRFGKPVYHDI